MRGERKEEGRGERKAGRCEERGKAIVKREEKKEKKK